MKPTKKNTIQGLLFEPRLSDMVDPKHELCVLSKLLPWEHLENEFQGLFTEKTGAPAKPTRLVVGIFMLQHMYGLSDNRVVQAWRENPYWQYFCGCDHLQWDYPINPSSLSRWRHRLGEEGMKKILISTVQAATHSGAVKATSLKNVIVDTTVMPKNIAYPTDSRLYYRGICTLAKMSEDNGLKLRQTYKRIGKKTMVKSCRYAHARQMKRAKKERSKLKTYLGRIFRDVKRQTENTSLWDMFRPILEIIEQLLNQEKGSKQKVYSIHEPHTECIAKGKAHKKYEFGCKVSLVITHKEGLAIGAEALHGNPYDGHTLQKALEMAENITGKKIKKAFVDKGYKGHGIEGKRVYVSGQKKGVTSWIRKQMKRRQAIEPHIGHMKNEGKLGRNYLKRMLGDKFNALLCGIGHNLRFLIRWIWKTSSAPQPC